MLGLGFRQPVSLQVHLALMQAGTAVAAVPVTFTIVASFEGEMAGGATLSAATVTTDAAGLASVDLTAGSSVVNFRVTAEAENASPATFFVMVNDAGFAELTVHPLHQGPRAASPFSALVVELFQNQPCPTLVPDSLPDPTFPPAPVSDGGTVSFAPLSPSIPYSVLAVARSGSGAVLASGCAEVAAGQLRAGATPILDLPVVERPLVLASSYHVSGTIDLGRVRDAVAGPGSPWATLSCAWGPPSSSSTAPSISSTATTPTTVSSAGPAPSPPSCRRRAPRWPSAAAAAPRASTTTSWPSSARR